MCSSSPIPGPRLSLLLCSQPLFGRIDQCRFASSKGGSQLGGLGGGTEGVKIVLEGAVGRQPSSSFPVLCCRDTHTVRACPLVGMFSRLRSEPQE